MKKIRKFYREHRVFTILMAVAVVCVALIVYVLIDCFYSGSDTNKWGTRCEAVEKLPITKAIKEEIIGKIEAEELVESASISVKCRRIETKIVFKPEAELIQAESIALKSLEYYSEEESQAYDFEFELQNPGSDKSDGFSIWGAKNKSGSGLIWNNNNPVTPATESEE